MQGIYNCTSGTNHVSRVCIYIYTHTYISAAILWFQFLVHELLFLMLNVLYYYYYYYYYYKFL